MWYALIIHLQIQYSVRTSCCIRIYNLSQFGPMACSLQFRHSPVFSSHTSDSPLQSQGRQKGKPQNPVWQRSQRRPVTSERHAHWPLTWSHSSDIEPRGSHSQAANKTAEKIFHSFDLKSRIICICFILLHNFWDFGCESSLRLQPSGPKPNVSGAQVSQQRPITLGLHSQNPPSLLQESPREPTALHLQTEYRN